MRAGDLRHRIDFQVETETADGMGGKNLTWAAVYRAVPAAIWPVSSRERLDNLKLESEITHKIRVRYISGITSKHRIKYGTRTFDIQGAPINHEERNRYLDILATEQIQ